MMHCQTLEALRAQVTTWKRAGLRIAFVPTMGNLHEGHLSLIRLAQQHADKVVSSVFVNPLQFGEGEDFERYPRTLAQDADALENVGCDLLFSPDVSLMYPNVSAQVRVCAPGILTERLEGATRPGHFDGVTTVVAKLFNMVQPDVAVFGQKDYQQWCVLSSMVTQLNWPIEMIKAPIILAQDGLALSSRNQYLNTSQRAIAPALYQSLQWMVACLNQGQRSYRDLESQATQRLLHAGFDGVDYVQVVDRTDLMPLHDHDPRASLVILAVARLGSTRLLDNIEWAELSPSLR